MDERITVDAEKCTGCKKCVKVCPAPLANIVKYSRERGFSVSLDPEKCIFCGRCTEVCESGARTFHDDTSRFMRHVRNKKRAAVVVSPAIRIKFPETWKAMLDYLQNEGVKVYNSETGAEIYVWAMLRARERSGHKSIVSSACPAAANYMKIYDSPKASRLSAVYSPLGCAAVYVRRILKWDEVIGAVAPCLSENTSSETFDYLITFDKLGAYFDRHRIELEKNSPYARFGSFHFDELSERTDINLCSPFGLRDAVVSAGEEAFVYGADGEDRVYDYLDLFCGEHERNLPDILSVYSCKNGCEGRCSGSCNPMFTSEALKCGGKKRKKASALRTILTDERPFRRFDETMTPEMFMGEAVRIGPEKAPSRKILEKIYIHMGKESEEKRNINCGLCGRKSCEGLALAVYHGADVCESCVLSDFSPEKFVCGELADARRRLGNAAAECSEYSNQLLEIITELREKNDAIKKSEDELVILSGAVSVLVENLLRLSEAYETLDYVRLKKTAVILERASRGLRRMQEDIKAELSSSAKIAGVISELVLITEEMNVTAYDAGLVDKYK